LAGTGRGEGYAGGLCDEPVVDRVAGGDHAVEQWCSERGEHGVGVRAGRKLTSFYRSGDDGRRAFGLVIEIASAHLAKWGRSQAGGEDGRNDLSSDAAVELVGEGPAER